MGRFFIFSAGTVKTRTSSLATCLRMFIRQQWYAALPSLRLKSKPIGVTRFGQKLVLWRDSNGNAVCMVDRCAHRLAQLSRGRVRDGCLECPYHGLRYDSAGHVAGLALRVPPLPLRESRGMIWVWNGEPRDALPDLPWNDALDAELNAGDRACTLEAEFDVPFQRVMENSTDFLHLPVVHRTTMPVRPPLTDFECHVDGNHIRVRGTMTGVSGTMHLVPPFAMLITFGTRVRFLAIATPIDANHTWLYARYVQDYVTLPFIGRAVTWLTGLFDYRLLQQLQDVPVWRSQQYEAPADLKDCHLIHGDAGVAAYFQIHERLLREGNETSDRLHREESAQRVLTR